MEEDQYCTHIYIYLLIINGTIKTNATYQRGGGEKKKEMGVLHTCGGTNGIRSASTPVSSGLFLGTYNRARA